MVSRRKLPRQVDNTFLNASGTNLQQVLQGVDTAIIMNRNRIREIEDVLPALGPGQTLDDIYVNITGDTMAGNLNMGGNSITNVNQVDGVDLESLNTRVGNLENGTTLDPRYVNITGDVMTGPLTATSFTGDGSGLTSLNGSNITSGTVADARIADSIARDSEIPTYDFSGWDTNASNDLTTSTQFGGDVTGGYDPGTGTVDIQISSPPPDPPASMRPLAYGSCNGNTEANGFNLANCSSDTVTGSARQVYFTTPSADTSYVVVATPSSPPPLVISTTDRQHYYVCGKSTTRFLVCASSGGVPGSFDFVVFKN